MMKKIVTVDTVSNIKRIKKFELPQYLQNCAARSKNSELTNNGTVVHCWRKVNGPFRCNNKQFGSRNMQQ